MSHSNSVVVRDLPEVLGPQESRIFFAEVEKLLNADQPYLVFDFSKTRDLRSAGIEMILRCMETAMKNNGDVKLAAVPPQICVVLEMTKVDRLFEIFETSADAAESFHRFPVQSVARKEVLRMVVDNNRADSSSDR